MKSLRLPLFLAALLGLAGLSAGTATAQTDTLTVKTQALGQCCWTFTVKNRNAAHTAINNLKLELVSTDVVFENADHSSPAWTFDFDNSIASFATTGNPIASGSDLGGFSFCFSNEKIGQPVDVKWQTRNNTNIVSQGVLRLICTEFQSLPTHDSASVTTSQLGGDPCFDFTIYNKNGLSQINRIVLQSANTINGTMRPSKIFAPAGWSLDSVTVNAAYFTAGQPLDLGQSVSGFKVCMRGNPNAPTYDFIWSALSTFGLIDRDTLKKIPNSVTTSLPSSDSVFALKEGGCLYTLSLSNFHVSNPQPPSRITGFTLTTSTPDVTFQTVTQTPPNWNKSVTPTSITFAAISETDGIPSGIINSQFGIAMNNPQGKAFDVDWKTTRAGAELSSGTLALQCQTEAASNDTATVVASAQNCCFTSTLTNRHNSPPSNIHAVGFAIPNGTGSISPTSSTRSWQYSQGTATSIRFQVPTTDPNEFQAPGTSQDFNFCLNPKTPGQNVTVTWTTYDQENTQINTGTFAIACSPISTLCDTVKLGNGNSDECRQSITVMNRRSGDISLSRVTFNPLNGWLVKGVSNIPGWQVNIPVNRQKADVTGSMPAGLEMTFDVQFVAADTNAKSPFPVEVASFSEQDNKTCLDTVMFSCLVKPDTAVASVKRMQEPSGIKLATSPNPFKSKTTVTLDVTGGGSKVNLILVDVLGTAVKTVTSGFVQEGSHHFEIAGSDIAPGTYYLRLESDRGVMTRKVVFTK